MDKIFIDYGKRINNAILSVIKEILKDLSKSKIPPKPLMTCLETRNGTGPSRIPTLIQPTCFPMQIGIQAAPLDNNVMAWQAVIFGPDDTPWEGGTFKLLMEFTEEYPNKPPAVRFLSHIFHPNVYGDGKICLDILQNQWSPIYDIAAILTSLS